jgi:hypothetical protein
MNFAFYQWVLSFVLDLLIKSAFLTFLGLLVTLSAAPISAFLGGAIIASTFHFICLFSACGLAALLELLRLKLPHVMRFVLILIVANVLFLGGCAVVAPQSGPATSGTVTVDSVMVVLNLVPIMIAVACGRILSRV